MFGINLRECEGSEDVQCTAPVPVCEAFLIP